MTQIQQHHQQEQENQAHVAVMAFPFGTHAAPLLDLALRLAAAAPHVQFSFFSTAKSIASIFGNQMVTHNLRAFQVDDGLPEDYVFSGKWGEDVELFLKATPGNFKEGLDKAVAETNKNVTCFITDAFLCFAADMAHQFNIPWISLWTAAASGLSSHLNTELIRQTIAQPPTPGAGAGDEDSLSLSKSVPGIYSEIRVKDLPLEVYGGNLESVFSRVLHQMSHTLPHSTAIVLNSFEDLDPTVIHHLKSKFSHCLTLGPFNLLPSSHHTDDPHGCLTWLSTKKPSSVAYVSFGTITTPPPTELAALAEALEESGIAFLWSIKDAQKVHFPTGFLDRTKESGRGMVVPWAPQKQVLNHTSTGAFVTHCGWNSILESISGGVPMICRPFFGDQNLNARLVSAVWGIGLVATNGLLSKNGLTEDFDSILHSQQGKKMRDKVAVLEQLAHQAVSPTGTSTHNFQTLLNLVTQVSSPPS